MKKINEYIDHTIIGKSVTAKDVIKTCNEAKQYRFRGVCVNPKWVKLTKKELAGTPIKVVVLIDDPIGVSEHKNRMDWCKKAVKDGADNLDIVMNLMDIKLEKWDKILKDLKPVCKLAPTKVIIGSGYLTDGEILKVSQIVKNAGGECVKTATEKDPLENRELDEKARHLQLMRKGAPGLEIKASGKIRTLADAKKMIKAGADIIGTSSSVKIMQEYEK